MPRILLINGHPNPNSFSAALSSAYERSARPLVEVQRLDLRKLTFDPVLRHGYEREQPLEPDLVQAAQAITAASHVVWFFPCWWNAPPALVKGFVDRVFTPGYAFRFHDGAKLPEKLLSGRSARLVSSMDSPRYWQRLVNGSAMEISFARSTLRFVGFAPVRRNIYYSAHSMDQRARERALTEMHAVATRDAQNLMRPGRPTKAPQPAATQPDATGP